MNRGRGLTSIRSSCNCAAIPGQDEEITRRVILRILLQEIKTFTDQTTATTDYIWDAAGNILTKTNLSGTTTYAWNSDNHHHSVTGPSGQVTTYGYDPFGIRVRMTDANGTKKFLYSREDLIGEFDSTNIQTSYYIHGPLTDEPLGQIINGTLSYMHRDGLGSVTALSNANVQLAGTHNYYAFGKVNETRGVSSRYGYTSRELDGNGLMRVIAYSYSLLLIVALFVNAEWIENKALVIARLATKRILKGVITSILLAWASISFALLFFPWANWTQSAKVIYIPLTLIAVMSIMFTQRALPVILDFVDKNKSRLE